MKEAADKEKRNTIERGLFHEGILAIAVIVEQTHTQSFIQYKVWCCHNHRCTHTGELYVTCRCYDKYCRVSTQTH